MNEDDRRKQLEARLIEAAWQLGRDPTATEGLLRGLAVPRHRLEANVLEAIDEPRDGPPIELSEELALAVIVARKIPTAQAATSEGTSTNNDVPTTTKALPVITIDDVAIEIRDALRVVLDDVEKFTRRFLATLSDDHFAVLAVWIVHTFGVEHAYATAYLHITSAERSSGKTRLLEVLDLLCCRSSGLLLDPSAASVFREIDSGEIVTFLLDEVDNYLAPGKIDSESRRAVLSILNGGYTKGATVARVIAAGTKSESVKRYHVFGPKALSGIGELPPTLASRSLRLPLKKRTKAETVERLRLRRVRSQAEELRNRIAAVIDVETVGAYLQQAEREVDELEDRLVDAVELIIALADLAGGDWPERIKRAVVTVAAGTADAVADASLGIKLLNDLRTITAELGGRRIATAVLIERLNGLEESPWGGFSKGKGINARDLARRLKPYSIHSDTVRLDAETTLKGYKIEDLADAFGRYLAAEPSHGSQPNSHAGLSDVFVRNNGPAVTDQEIAANPHGYAEVTDVTAKSPNPGPGGADHRIREDGEDSNG